MLLVVKTSCLATDNLGILRNQLRSRRAVVVKKLLDKFNAREYLALAWIALERLMDSCGYSKTQKADKARS